MGNMNVFLVWNIIVIYILQYIFFLISSNRIYQNYHPSILFFD